MTNKNKPNNRSNKRNIKLPTKYNDHVMSNNRQNKSNSDHNKKIDEIRVNIGGNDEDNDMMANKLGDKNNKMGDLNASYDDNSGFKTNKPDDNDSVSSNSNKEGLESDKECLEDDVQEIKQNEISSENSVKSMLNENKGNETETSSPIKTYAHVTMNLEISMHNQLRSIPTVLNDSGEEVVVFDEEMVKIGSKKWELTLCGQSVGYHMSLPMLNYHLRRMWSRYGYKDIVDNGNGKWLFKFSRDDGLNEGAAKSLQMVNGKPLLVYRWDPNIGLDKVVLVDKIGQARLLLQSELSRFLRSDCEGVLVDKIGQARFVGISVIASCLGKPKIIDSMTTYVCKSGMGRTEFARVLVEIEAIKGLKDEIELQYRDKNQVVKRTKKVKVEYDWKPPVCSYFNVFGHSFEKCSKRTRTMEEITRET
ncbi:RNA-directed DNA polymerase, eukaryota, reverse transcriptase zinc-binding domain protein [Tanacetum coccineum]